MAIRGISGIGKSTLFKLLLGVFRPDEGEIKLCFKDGEEVTVSPDTRRMFAYVPQGNFLFSGTIRENLTLIKDADDETIKQALIASDIYDFVSKLPMEWILRLVKTPWDYQKVRHKELQLREQL